MGVASSSTAGTAGCTSGEREEALLDLHGLHGTEAINVLESFLVALEGEHFLGLGEWARERERGREGRVETVFALTLVSILPFRSQPTLWWERRSIRGLKMLDEELRRFGWLRW